MSKRSLAAVVLLAASWWARAELPYQLPAKAKYTASSEAITTPFFQFEKGKVFWADEVRRMQSKK